MSVKEAHEREQVGGGWPCLLNVLEGDLPGDKNGILCLPVATKLSFIAAEKAGPLALAPPELVELLPHRISRCSLGNVGRRLYHGERHVLERRRELVYVYVTRFTLPS